MANLASNYMDNKKFVTYAYELYYKHFAKFSNALSIGL